MSRTDSESPSSSPARKRQRLSSPTYDAQLADLSQDDLDAFDAFEAKLSQDSQSLRKTPHNQEAREKGAKAIANALSGKDGIQENARHNPDLGSCPTATINALNPDFPLGQQDDPDNPFTARFTSASNVISPSKAFFTATSLPTSSFTSAFQFGSDFQISQDHARSPSPEIPLERDYSSWFEPEPALAPLAFQSAKFAAASSLPASNLIGPSIGFMKASEKGWIAPSVAAFTKAQEKMKQIWQEGDPDPAVSNSSSSSQPNDTENAFRPVSSLTSLSPPKRPALRAVQNSFSPGTPTPPGASFSRPSASNTLASVSSASGIHHLKGQTKAKPFKSPFLNPPVPTKNLHVPSASATGSGFPSSPLNPNSRTTPLPGTFVSAGSQHPLASTPITAVNTTPKRVTTSGGAGGAGTTTVFTTSVRPLGSTQRVGTGKNTPAAFITPFKAGMKPGEPGRLRLEEAKMKEVKQAASPVAPANPMENWLTRERPGQADGKGKERWKAFDLTKHPNRQTLASSGLLPQQYTSDELESMGINVTELGQITATLAQYYSFHTSAAPSSSFPSLSPVTPPTLRGASAALDELLDRGCWLATKPWVDNHWCLILWKLAGMVSLDPKQGAKRWCWDEVMRQFLYRYERELNGGSRPPLRLIATQDAPASSPMVLCVSNVMWSGGGVTEDGMPIETHPELEVTDGWYRLRAQVDQPLARAVRKGIIRIGRKIGVAGARLSSERKEPTEVLEAYNTTKLVLSGNSSHMVAWHAKLGFVMGPCVATLHSLTADGGNVAAMDVVVVKTYPVAFIEFIEDEDGQRHREGPRSESDEARVNELWKRRREVEESKLRSELEKTLTRYEGYADRLERRAGARFNPEDDDSPPDHIETLYDELENHTDAASALARLSPDEAGWLARFIRDRTEKDRETSGEKFELELKSICPPREVRDFRVLVVQDTCTRRRPANRTAQLTVWDVLSLSLSEGSAAGSFEAGNRFLVTNLIPTQQTAWMDCEVGSEVYLSTRRDSRWTRMKC